jgi:hypothetical protein
MFVASLLVAVTSFLTVPSAPNPVGDPATVWHFILGVTLDEFTAARAAHQPPHLDWSADGCSTQTPVGLGDTGRSFDFRAACNHHDFGYRNLKLLDRRYHCPRRPLDRYCAPGTWSYGKHWNGPNRLKVDDRFLADMRLDCAGRPVSQRATCRAWAWTYYQAVRAFGGP